jgi:hypothetical protein
MAHDLETQNGVASFASFREPAWHNLGTVFDTEKNVVETPVKDYVFYPFSINRKMLKRFGVDISSFNRTYPARNTPAFKAVPNFGFFTKKRKRSRKRAQ